MAERPARGAGRSGGGVCPGAPAGGALIAQRVPVVVVLALAAGDGVVEGDTVELEGGVAHGGQEVAGHPFDGDLLVDLAVGQR